MVNKHFAKNNKYVCSDLACQITFIVSCGTVGIKLKWWAEHYKKRGSLVKDVVWIIPVSEHSCKISTVKDLLQLKHSDHDANVRKVRLSIRYRHKDI